MCINLGQEQQTNFIFCSKLCRSVRSKQNIIFKHISRNDNPADISTLGYLLWTERSVHPGGNKGNHRTGPITKERIKGALQFTRLSTRKTQ